MRERRRAPGLPPRLVDAVVDRGVLPDTVLRMAVRRLLARRLARLEEGTAAQQRERKTATLMELASDPVALATDEANEQHYEVPARFFELMLGPRLKYSSGWWPDGVDTLADAEVAMLDLTVERAGLRDGEDVLELGCGWGSLTLHMAERLPRARITAVSNSRSQREHVLARAAERGLDNVEVVTADVNELQLPTDAFDRCVSVEMFEHVRNHGVLLARVADWLRPGGTLFVHHFAHREHVYPFDVDGRTDWMARHFFTDGVMPSDDLLLHHAEHLRVVRRWVVDGTHYARTCEAWLANLDAHREEVEALFAATHGVADARRWWRRWRVFDIACAELFAHGDGRQWWVSHLLLTS